MPPARSMRSSAALVSVVLRFACLIGRRFQVRSRSPSEACVPVTSASPRATMPTSAPLHSAATTSSAGLGVVQVSGGDDARPSRSGRERVSGRRGTDLVADNCDRPDDADPSPAPPTCWCRSTPATCAEPEERARHLRRMVSLPTASPTARGLRTRLRGSRRRRRRPSHRRRVGDRVYVNPGMSCGGCRAWRQGQDQNCDRYTFMGYFSFGADGQQTSTPTPTVASAST